MYTMNIYNCQPKLGVSHSAKFVVTRLPPGNAGKNSGSFFCDSVAVAAKIRCRSSRVRQRLPSREPSMSAHRMKRHGFRRNLD